MPSHSSADNDTDWYDRTVFKEMDPFATDEAI